MIAEVETANLLVCAIADELYALPMPVVREVIRWRAATPIPGTASTVLGVIHHRGAVLPLIDVRAMLGFAPAPPTRSTRLLVVDDNGLQAALVCDAVMDLAEVERSTFEPPPASLPAARAQFVDALLEWQARPVALLSLADLFVAVKAAHGGG
jgi:purine-binding chemotaxis protein CheW